MECHCDNLSPSIRGDETSPMPSNFLKAIIIVEGSIADTGWAAGEELAKASEEIISSTVREELIGCLGGGTLGRVKTQRIAGCS